MRYLRLLENGSSIWTDKLLNFFPKRVIDEALNNWKDIDVDIDGEKQIIKAAQAKDKTAIVYCWYKVLNVTAQMFWSYLGPNNKARQQRIKEGDFDVYVAIAYETLTFGKRDTEKDVGLLDRFDADKYYEKSLWPQFGKLYRLLLMNITKYYNEHRNKGGIVTKYAKVDDNFTVDSYESFSKIKLEDDDIARNSVEENYEKKQVFDDINKNFIKKWKIYTQDEKLHTKKKGIISPGELLYIALINPNIAFKLLEEKYNVSRAFLQKTLEDSANIMTYNDISKHEFRIAKSMFGEDRLASYIDAGRLANTDAKY